MQRLLNDPRDLPQVRLLLASSSVLVFAVALFWLGHFSWWLAVGYWALWGGVFGDRVTTMLHTFIHRPLFKRRYALLNGYVTWILAPLFGQTPTSFYVHHVGMHHPEGNLPEDLSSTMRYQRDSVLDFFRYYLRFAVLGTFTLLRYHLQKRRYKFATRFAIGKVVHYGALIGLGLYFPQATFVVLILPFVLTSFMLMAGNWAQHAFIVPEEPENDYKNSIIVVWDRYNDRCFNDGYHTFHHVRPTVHYSELKREFEDNRERYAAEGTLVFDGIDFVGVWFLLMSGKYEALARRCVQHPGGRHLETDELVALFKRRLVPIRESEHDAVAPSSVVSVA